MKKAVIVRHEENYGGTWGVFHLFGEEGNILVSTHTLEPLWKDNEQNISCIPPGIYQVFRHNSPKHGDTLKLLEVPGRSDILVHAGNGPGDTRGCVLVGDICFDEKDKKKLFSSKLTLKKILPYFGNIPTILAIF